MTDQSSLFNRDLSIEKLQQETQWDFLVIGGGATGLGIALDAASRGYKTLLLEQSDFAKGTSSRSTKLVHGGVRYLAQGDVGLVREALKERGILFNNAPHLVKKQAFIIPCFSWFSKMKYLVGLTLYDWLSGKYSFGKSTSMSKTEVQNAIPDINSSSLRGGVEYYDGQFDDSRLAIDIAKTAAEHGGTLINYVKVTKLLKNQEGKVEGVSAYDAENQATYNIKSKVVINATGVFVDEILHMDHPEKKPMTRPSQGIHLVLDRSFWNSDKALMIPKTSDGRVLFAVPWHEHLLLGTTDTPLDKHSLEPIALEAEIKFILKTAQQYLSKKPERSDVLSVFAGLRPLAAPDKDVDSTKEISRSHKIYIEPSELITITGGKWTTYRKMAEDTVDKAIKVKGLDKRACRTVDLPINNGVEMPSNGLQADASDIALHSEYKISELGIINAVRFEMARTVEDVLARRFRILFLDAEAAVKLAPEVARVMAQELKKDEIWIKEQVAEFITVADAYQIQYFNAFV